MGHSSIKITMNTYSHVIQEVHQQGIDAINQIIDSGKRYGT